VRAVAETDELPRQGAAPLLVADELAQVPRAFGSRNSISCEVSRVGLLVSREGVSPQRRFVGWLKRPNGAAMELWSDLQLER
jgi:hypothetical protein